MIDVEDVWAASLQLKNTNYLRELWKLPEYIVDSSSPEPYCAGLTGCINSDADCQHACWLRARQSSSKERETYVTALNRQNVSIHYHTWIGEREVIIVSKPYSADWDESYWVCDNPGHVETE